IIRDISSRSQLGWANLEISWRQFILGQVDYHLGQGLKISLGRNTHAAQPYATGNPSLPVQIIGDVSRRSCELAPIGCRRRRQGWRLTGRTIGRLLDVDAVSFFAARTTANIFIEQSESFGS